MKNTTKFFMCMAAAAVLIPCSDASALESVQVRLLPAISVIDDISVYNPAVEYPVLSYNDITYLPLTYELCARLGIAVGFDASSGFYAASYEGLPYAFEADGVFGAETVNLPWEEYTAYIPEYPVYLNGVRLDNFKEEYPFLNFRGVTYLPLTYRFATEELDLNVNRTSEGGLYLYKNNTRKHAYFGKSNSEGVNITVNTAVSTVIGKNEYGSEILTDKYCYDRYRLLFESGYAVYIGSSENASDGDYPDMELYPLCEKVKLENGVLFYEDTELMNFSGTNAVGQYSREYVFGDVSFIVSNVSFGNAPAPYTSHSEYIFVKKTDGTERLEQWDVNNNFSAVYKDGSGGYYLCSDYYSPTGASRWSNDFACIYRYTPDGDFREVTVKDTNSVKAIGVHGTKLYVKAMYYSSDKSAVINMSVPISTVNSGFYEIDSADGKVRKLYPYISGEVFLSDSGSLYCLTDFGLLPRIVNLVTGRITEI